MTKPQIVSRPLPGSIPPRDPRLQYLEQFFCSNRYRIRDALMAAAADKSKLWLTVHICPKDKELRLATQTKNSQAFSYDIGVKMPREGLPINEKRCDRLVDEAIARLFHSAVQAWDMLRRANHEAVSVEITFRDLVAHGTSYTFSSPLGTNAPAPPSLDTLVPPSSILLTPWLPPLAPQGNNSPTASSSLETPKEPRSPLDTPNPTSNP